MPRESYDLIVLGDELAGLVAATLCARRGMRVLLAQVAPRKASYVVAGIRLSVEPLILPGLGAPAIRRVLDELHFPHLVKRKLRAQAPAFQLVTPEVRLDLDSDDAAAQRELGRELAADHPAARQLERAAELSRHLDDLVAGGAIVPPAGFWERREVGKQAGDLVSQATAWDAGHGDAVGAALAHLPAALTGLAGPDGLPALAAARGLDLLRQGAPRLIGDLDALREIFLDKFASHSGEVRVVEPAALVTSWGKVTGLGLAGGEEIGAGHLIAALPVARLAPLCDGKLARRLAELGANLAVGGHRYTLNLVMDAIGVPEGMGALVLAQADLDAPMTDGNGFAIHVAPPDDQARVVVTVQAVARPAGPGESLDANLAALRARLRQHLEMVMPFAASHIRLAHSPNQDLAAEGTTAEAGLVAPPRTLWRLGEAGALGLAGLDYGVGVKHLTLASDQILPGLGFEGELIAGWSAARLACEAAGKKRDYLHGEIIQHS